MDKRTGSSRAFFLWGALALILVFAAAPLLSVIAAASIAEAAGCTIHEGAPHPCLVLGVDLGSSLYGMFVAGWLSFLTLPIGLAALAAWLVTALFMWLRRS